MTKMMYMVARQSQIEAIDIVIKYIDGRALILAETKSNMLSMREILVCPESDSVIFELQKIIEETVYDVLKVGERVETDSV